MNIKSIKYSIFGVLLAGLSFSISAAPVDNSYEPNDSLSGAWDITSDINATITAVSLDNEDWYKIIVGAGTNRVTINLQFSDVVNDLELYLVDDLVGSELVFLASSTGNTDIENIEFDVDPAGGTYYIAVTPYNDVYVETTYTLLWNSVAPVDDLYEVNNTAIDAFNLAAEENVWLSNVSGLGISNDDDWYSITVKPDFTQVKIDATFLHSSADLDIFLYDAAGTVLASSNSATNDEHINFDVGTAGTYLIKVTAGAFSGATYDLRWDTATVLLTGSVGFISVFLLPLLVVLRRKIRA